MTQPTDPPVPWTGKWHPYAERFPLMSEVDLRDLADSIKADGQRHPCVMDSAGLGIDGRNRVAACGIAEVEPRWVVDDGDPVRLILSENTKRRQMATGARAMVVAVGLAELGLRDRDKGRWKRGSVPGGGDNRGSSISAGWKLALTQAGVVLDWRDDLADAVISGETALDEAYGKAQDKRTRDEGDTAKRQKLRVKAPDLYALVVAGSRDVDDALREAGHRSTVRAVDKTRDADESPPPSFEQRVEDGAVSWEEAATLAEQWRDERDASIGRDQERLRGLSVAWPVLQDVATNPDRPYITEILEGLGAADTDAVRRIIEQLGSAQ